MPGWFDIQNVSNDRVDIYIYDEIGKYSISAREFIEQFNHKVTGSILNIDVHINSPGGSVFEGNAIYNFLANQNLGRFVNTYVDGVAASIASVIAMAGRRIHIAANGIMMIHNPEGGAYGDHRTMVKMADILNRIKESIISAYSRTGQDRQYISDLMNEETWISSEECLSMGFCDEIIQAKDYKNFYSLANFRNYEDFMNNRYVGNNDNGFINNRYDRQQQYAAQQPTNGMQPTQQYVVQQPTNGMQPPQQYVVQQPANGMQPPQQYAVQQPANGMQPPQQYAVQQPANGMQPTQQYAVQQPANGMQPTQQYAVQPLANGMQPTQQYAVQQPANGMQQPEQQFANPRQVAIQRLFSVLPYEYQNLMVECLIDDYCDLNEAKRRIMQLKSQSYLQPGNIAPITADTNFFTNPSDSYQQALSNFVEAVKDHNQSIGQLPTGTLPRGY